MELRRLQELADVQDEALEQIDVSGTRRRLLEQPSQLATRAPSPRLRRAAMLMAAAALLVALVWRWRAPLDYAVNGHALATHTWWVVPPESTEELSFTDGTRFVLTPGTRVQVDEVTANGAHVVVGDGKVWAHVQPLPGAQWSVGLGPYQIRVTGTVFTAAWHEARGELEVELIEGGVTVVGPKLGTGLSLRAGERMAIGSSRDLELGPIEPYLDASLDTGTAGGDEPSATAPAAPTAAPAAPTASTDASATANDAPPSAPTAPTHVSSPASSTTAAAESDGPNPSWTELMANKQYAEALAVAQPSWATLCAESSAERLIQLADLARFAGDGTRSAQALSALRQRFAGHPLAARAAFLLGRSAYAGRAGDWGASWFVIYLSEAPRGPFAAEAMGRLIEAHAGAGNTDAARATARAYLTRFPKGPYAPLAKRLTSEVEQK